MGTAVALTDQDIEDIRLAMAVAIGMYMEYGEWLLDHPELEMYSEDDGVDVETMVERWYELDRTLLGGRR